MTAPQVTLRALWRQTFPDHGSPGEFAFSPSGRRLVLGSVRRRRDGHSIGSLTVFDAPSGEVVHRTLDTWIVLSVAFASDTGMLLTGELEFNEVEATEQGRVRVLALDPLTEQSAHPMQFGFQRPVFSPDGQRFVIDNTPLRVFDTPTGTELWRRDHTDLRFAWSPDSASLAAHEAGSESLEILDALNGRTLRTFSAPAPISDLGYSPDGTTLAVSLKGNLCAMDAATGALRWSAPTVGMTSGGSVTVSPDGRWVAVRASNDQRMALGNYDLATGAPRFAPVTFAGSNIPQSPVQYSATLRHIVLQLGLRVQVVDARTGAIYANIDGGLASATLAPDGGSIAIGKDRTPHVAGFVECYDLGLLIASATLATAPLSVAMSPSGVALIAAAESNRVTLIAADTGREVTRKPIPGSVVAAVFAEGGQSICAGSTAGVVFASILGARSWTDTSVGAVNAVAAVGSAGDWIAVAAGRTLRLLRSADGLLRWTPATLPQVVTRLAASSDGKWVATGCRDRVTRITDTATGAEKFASETRNGVVRALAFQPGRSVLATGNEDGTVILVDAVTASEIGRAARPFGCSQLAFSPDATLLAVAWDDNAVSVYDVAAGAPSLIQEFEAAGPVSALAINPADNTVVVATDASTVSVYDSRTAVELARILHPDAVGRFAISVDGGVIATACADFVVRTWQSP